MTSEVFFALVGAGLLAMGLHALIVRVHLLRKIIAINVMGSGVFLIVVALARRAGDGGPDPIPHAMVITGIVVAISATALALALLLMMTTATGSPELPDDSRD